MMALDGFVSIIIFLSAFLAMMRGFARELLSLLSWILAGTLSYIAYSPTLPFIEYYILNHVVAVVATISMLFLIALFMLSIVAMKIADLIVGSRIGALDRTLGFAFGVVRGVLILAVAMLFLNGLITTTNRPTWIANAKTTPILDAIGSTIWSVIPQKLLQKLDKEIDSSDMLVIPNDNKRRRSSNF